MKVLITWSCLRISCTCSHTTYVIDTFIAHLPYSPLSMNHYHHFFSENYEIPILKWFFFALFCQLGWLVPFFSQRHPEIRGFHQNDESNVALLWHKLCSIHTFVPHQGTCIKGTSLCHNNTMLLLSFAYSPPPPTLQMPLPPLFLPEKKFSQLEKLLRQLTMENYRNILIQNVT